MLARQEPITSPVITIDVDDIEAALKRVEELGGKVLRDKMAVGEMGFAAYFADSEGNVLGLWQSTPS
jgi:predicted enzyme related to lactoylglutathione lyase